MSHRSELHELVVKGGKRAAWVSFSNPEPAYLFRAPRDGGGYRPDVVPRAPIEHVPPLLRRHVSDKPPVGQRPA